MASTRKTKAKQAAMKKLKAEATKRGMSVEDLLQEMKSGGQDGQKKPQAARAKKANGKNSKSNDEEELPRLLKRKPDYDSDDEDDDDGFDETEGYRYESDDDDEDEVEMFEAQRSRAHAPKPKVQPPDSELIMSLLACGKKAEAKGKMKLAIRRVVRLNLFRFKKFIEEETSRDIAAEYILEQLNFKDIDEEAKKSWIDTYGPFVVKYINEARGYAQTGIKKVMFNYWSANGKVVLEKKWYPLILKRNLDMTKDQDYEVFKLWVTEIIPKACGYAGGWDEKKYYYKEIQNAVNEKNPNDMAVTASTEAVAAWILENNYTNWPQQWAVKDAYPTLKMEKHYNGADKKPLSVANSYVSFLCPVCPDFFLHCPSNNGLCTFHRSRRICRPRRSTSMARSFMPSGPMPQRVSQATPVSSSPV